MDEFLAQLSDLDLCHIVKGEGMSSPKVTPGTAAAFGGLTPTLTYFGIPGWLLHRWSVRPSHGLRY